MPSLVAYNTKVKFTEFKVDLCIIIKYNTDTLCTHENQYRGGHPYFDKQVSMHNSAKI